MDGCCAKGPAAHLVLNVVVHHKHCTSRGGIVSPGHNFNP